MLCSTMSPLGPMSSSSHQGSPKPLAGAPRWQPLVFMLRGSGGPQGFSPPSHILAFTSMAHLLSTPGPMQQSPSQPPEGCPCHRQLHPQRPARLTTAGAAQTCWPLVQGNRAHLAFSRTVGRACLSSSVSMAPGCFHDWGPWEWGSHTHFKDPSS